MALSDLDTRKLSAVGRVLQRVPEADFGICEDYGAAIPFDRLKIEPHAQRCMACETIFEQRKRNP